MENGHREYDVTCTMFGPDGAMLGQGVGSGSTMEKKYRYRKEGEKRIENEDIADTYNTVLKMAKKRAQIDATLTVTGAADMFTQDLIENEDEPAKEPIKEPQAKKQEPQPPQEGDKVAGVIQVVSVKEGGTEAKPWIKFGVKVSDVWYSTFDKKIGEAAEGLKGKEAIIHYKKDDKGYNVIQSLFESDSLPR